MNEVNPTKLFETLMNEHHWLSCEVTRMGQVLSMAEQNNWPTLTEVDAQYREAHAKAAGAFRMLQLVREAYGFN